MFKCNYCIIVYEHKGMDMNHKIVNTNKMNIIEDVYRDKITRMLDMGYKSTMIDGQRVTIVHNDIVNVNNKAELLTIVRVEG